VLGAIPQNQASHCFHALSNRALASSSVGAWSFVCTLGGLPTTPYSVQKLCVDAAHRPLAAVDSKILPVLVDRRRKPGRAHGERHQDSTFRRSPEDLRLGQIELRLQNRSLSFGLRSRRKGFAYAPQRMAIQDVPLK